MTGNTRHAGGHGAGPAQKIQLVVHAGSDDAFIAWTSGFIAECRGFALLRKIKRGAGSPESPTAAAAPDADGFVNETVSSWVGFADDPKTYEPGARFPTTQWPIQKYLWSDFAVKSGDVVKYRIVPMVGDYKALRALDGDGDASAWSAPVTIGGDGEGKVSCYFNRGIVASQWLSRVLPSDPDPKKDKLEKGRKLVDIIATVGDRTRNFLAGHLRVKLLSLLHETRGAGGHIYAALFELEDPEIVAELKQFRKRGHIVLGNGSVKKKGEDENSDAREELASLCDIHDRFTAPRALAHNKFIVFCDSDKKPLRVWTGSTNLTESGLCTQANNGLLIDDPAAAQAYLDHWTVLKDAGDASPAEMKEANQTPHDIHEDLTVWFTPMSESNDLEQAGELIRGAKQGILFLMFNPGPRGTLLNDIIELASPHGPHYKPDLYIQGVLNQNPGTDKNPVVLFNRGERIDANADVVLPAAIDERLKFWIPELEKLPRAHAMVHSKVVIVDPYGSDPVVMTGSHNMGPKASTVNDENFVIVKGDRALASKYASKIMEIYNQYRWNGSKHDWPGLANKADWQIGAPGADAKTQAYDRRRERELDFWFGRG
ncbi:MAG: phospholipase D-like domain-containing protein [Rhizomicrobium sp.]